MLGPATRRASRSSRSWRPTTPDERLARIGARARGFLYTVSVTGTTGERAALADAFAAVVARAKAHTDVPVALGFGIATPEQAAAGGRAPAPTASSSAAASSAPPPRPTTRPRPCRRGSSTGSPAAPPLGFAAAMGFVLATTVGLVVWIVLWALGAKAHRRLPDHAS